MGTSKSDLEQNSTMNLCTHHATPNLFYYFIYYANLFYYLHFPVLGSSETNPRRHYSHKYFS